eukprot:TRINITY_DN13164_c0_g1_i3.p1 TRINITY_DN13164_c0_g1~~TRINITY_DN13164_c0_g1_i3.p1  ORF type:complete len:251 (-),score=24.40 TRINITY_DN13164_c0_g1_i3:150-902(-)
MIQMNTKNKIGMDISKEVNKLKSILKEENRDCALKLFVLEENEIFQLMKVIMQVYANVKMSENVFSQKKSYVKNVVKQFADKLRINIHLYYDSQTSKGRPITELVECFGENKTTVNEIFPDLADDELAIKMQPFNTEGIIYIIGNEKNSSPQACKHYTYTAEYSIKFTKADSMWKYKFCVLCNTEVSKRKFAERLSNMCMNCLTLIGLRKNRVELQCCHKYCIECFKELNIFHSNEMYCLICSSMRTLCS